jgi:hypothetical protein
MLVGLPYYKMEDAPERYLSTKLRGVTFRKIVVLINCRVLESPAMRPIVSQRTPTHAFPTCFLKTNFNIILSFTHGSPYVYFFFGISYENFVCISLYPRYSYFILTDLTILIISGEKLRSSSLRNCDLRPVMFSFLKPSILLGL